MQTENFGAVDLIYTEDRLIFTADFDPKFDDTFEDDWDRAEARVRVLGFEPPANEAEAEPDYWNDDFEMYVCYPINQEVDLNDTEARELA